MIDIDDLPSILQNIYDTLVVDADDVGLALDDVMMYVQEFEMDEDMLYSFIKDKISEKKEKKEDKDIKEAYYVSFIKKYNKNNKFF
jgi:hypothetical protein|tara:strand:+ start:382 stop:639 length:258 start_codon:yes stop_codon:yes gene_type:complete